MCKKTSSIQNKNKEVFDMRRFIIVLIALNFVACAPRYSNQNENAVKNNTEPIHFETKQQQRDRLGVRDKSIGEQGGYPQTYRDYNKGPDKERYSDIFTNAESVRLEAHLKTFKEIKQAQVASTKDRVVIGILLNNRFQEDKNVAIDIKKSVEEIVPNKTVVVYTDHIHWDRMRELRAKKVDNPETLLESWFGE